MNSTLLVNARLVNEGREFDGDLRIKDGRIEQIGSGLAARKGDAADLVLVEHIPWTVQRSDVLSKCGWSPFEGTTFHSRIAATRVNGQLGWDGTALLGEPISQRLQFDQ